MSEACLLLYQPIIRAVEALSSIYILHMKWGSLVCYIYGLFAKLRVEDLLFVNLELKKDYF